MRIGAGLSTGTDARQAAIEAAMAARRPLEDARATLAVVFGSPHHAAGAAALLEAVHEACRPEALIGCIGEAILGGRREVEGEPAVAVWLGAFEASTETFHVQFQATEEGHGAFTGWPEEGDRFLLVCDPFTFPVDGLLRELDHRQPGVAVIGGMASGGTQAGETRLFLDDRVVDSGAVGARLPQAVAVGSLVSQGCRPVGSSYTVTKARGNVIAELAGRPPLERVQEVFASLSAEERDLMTNGLHVGRVIDEYRAEFGPGDFLIRGVIGADQETGAIAVGDRVEVGETIQFHVRDAATADEELRKMLAAAGDRQPAGALLFTCNGRGTRLFPVPDHDASLVSSEFGDPPLAGFFCAGELGPVGGRNFLHGFTASLALFYPEAHQD